MKNIIDYAETYHFPFEERPFSPVDSLVLSQLSYLRFENCGLSRRGRHLQLGSLAVEMRNHALLENVPSTSRMLALMYAVATSPRFRWLSATHYANHMDAEAEKQFSALTYVFEDGSIFVAFRGTDGSIVGWKENFNMVHLPVTPAQQESVDYLESVAAQHDGPILVGGHSKGGNLAIYAAACCSPETQDRIHRVFNHDGPGFQPEFYELPGYHRIRGHIHKTVPEAAVIGMLLPQQDPYIIVESGEQGLAQHSALTWAVENGAFVEKERIQEDTRLAVGLFNNWMQALDAAHRKTIVDALFEIVDATKATTIQGLLFEAIRNAPAVIQVLTDMPPEKKGLLYEKLEALDASFQQQEKEDRQA